MSLVLLIFICVALFIVIIIGVITFVVIKVINGDSGLSKNIEKFANEHNFRFQKGMSVNLSNRMLENKKWHEEGYKLPFTQEDLKKFRESSRNLNHSYVYVDKYANFSVYPFQAGLNQVVANIIEGNYGGLNFCAYTHGFEKLTKYPAALAGPAVLSFGGNGSSEGLIIHGVVILQVGELENIQEQHRFNCEDGYIYYEKGCLIKITEKKLRTEQILSGLDELIKIYASIMKRK
ncbi:MAG: hypothetical protein LBM13_06240 [Candidatus Ancillula sp.]|jgi:hypothetical protein|nr:hypothetical protein [Candidatus Ancillula sp.]